MVIVEMVGGLGNQLFQYAAARSLAEKHHVSIRVDLSWYVTQSERQYQLDEFRMKLKPASPWDYLRVNTWLGMSRILQALFGDCKSRPLRWLIKKTWQSCAYNRLGSDNGAQRQLENSGVACQRFFHFDPDFFDLPDNVYLSGFWQSYKYFDCIRREILQEIVLRHPLGPRCLALLDRILSSESVSIHIRRGDKVNNTNYYATDLGYVECAVRKIETKIKQPLYFVFTDELEWVMANLDVGVEVIYAGNQAAMTDCEELILMSKCKHNIIAESSFSWWAAWLNVNQDKVVISPSPERWINADDRVKRDLLPEKWLVVDCNEYEDRINGDDRKACK